MSEWQRVTRLSPNNFGDECLVANSYGVWVKSVIGLDGEFYTEDGCCKVSVIPCFFMLVPSVPDL